MSPLREEERGLVEVLTKLIPAFEAVRDGWESERKSRNRERWFLVIGAIVISALLVTLLLLVLVFHQTATKTLDTNRLIRDCVNAPAHPSPPGTPFQKLTCYERNQVQSSSAIFQLLKGQRQLDQTLLDGQRTLDQALLRDLKPGTKVTLPVITIPPVAFVLTPVGNTSTSSTTTTTTTTTVPQRSPTTTTTMPTTTTTFPITTTTTLAFGCFVLPTGKKICIGRIHFRA